MQVSKPESAQGKPLSYRPDIDGLRAIAIVSVVVFHAFPDAMPGGFIGVDIFFVISGFLISSIIFRQLDQGRFSFTDFYVHRIRRIFPALILVLASCFVLGWFSLLPEEYRQLGKHMAAGAGFIQNLVLWKESGYFDVESDMKPLLHLWSLSVEEQFYLVYPLLVCGLWRARMPLRKCLVLLMLASFALNLWWVAQDPVKTFYLPFTRVWELLAGALCAFGVMRKGVAFSTSSFRLPHLPSLHLRSVLGLALLLCGLVLIDRHRYFPGAWALLPVTGAVLLVSSGPQAWVNRHLLSRPLLVWIGLVSYPLYLWHWPILSFMHILTPTRPGAPLRLAAVALSVLLAWLTYRLLERPVRFGAKSWMVPALLALLLSVTATAGYNDFQRNGLSFRLATHYAEQPLFVGTTDATCTADGGAGLEFCRQSHPGAPTIVVIGDSHAWHLYDGLASYAAHSGDIIGMRAVGACLGFSGVSADTKRHDCAPARDSIASAARQASVRTVVLSARLDIYDRELPGEVFEGALRDMLATLTAAGKKVIFVMDIPILDFHPKYCLDISMPLRPKTTSLPNCAIQQAVFAQHTQHYRETVNALLRQFPQVQVFDAAAPLCDHQQCWAMKDGQLLYRDYDHLSTIGSTLVAQTLWPLIHPIPQPGLRAAATKASPARKRS
ncbi:peptidoglycan/LPS O-acetylase OafA/YrhL [Herbaspirillum seropedicae]|uniref:acyltransferase family protein n=1 Tax=Herbaspirillum seropedicae TaxID=964 RepID=UPI00339AC9E1